MLVKILTIFEDCFSITHNIEVLSERVGYLWVGPRVFLLSGLISV